MSETENTTDQGAPIKRPTYDETDVNAESLRDVNSTTPEVDRTSFNPRGRLQALGRGSVAAVAVGAAFVGFVVFAMASQTHNGTAKKDDSTFQLYDDASAEKSARQAASSVALDDSTAKTKPLTDPFGNPIIPEGQDLSAGAAGATAQARSGDPATERADRIEQQRMATIQKEVARQDAMRRAPLMAVAPVAGAGLGGQPNAGPFGNLTLGGGTGDSAGTRAGTKEDNPLAAKLDGMTIEKVSAGRLANRNFLITAGMQIPCVLQTAMDSTQPGLTNCLIPQDIWSANGSVILMEKGTRVLGEFQGGFSTGQHRIFVLWNRAITPAGVSVSLGSPAADQLGRAGMGGKVENFFWQRFGGALLLSIVGDAGNAVSNSISGAQQTFGASDTAASIAAQDSQRIRPRLTAPQGKEMTIMVARDVDFSNVYSLRLRR